MLTYTVTNRLWFDIIKPQAFALLVVAIELHEISDSIAYFFRYVRADGGKAA